MIFSSGARKRRQVVRLARAASDAGRYVHAALLYQEALRLAPNDAAVHIQCGHMFKEVGDLANAEHHYKQAKELAPDDADLMLQLGHFYKIAGRLPQAEQAYRRAI